jgi:hypothetical protein
MANYVAHHTKKRGRLARLEEDLLRSIRNGDLRDRQLTLADEIRLARIRVLQTVRANFLPSGGGRHQRYGALVGDKRYRKKIEAEISALEAISAKEILSEFSVRASKAHDVSA